MRSHECSYCIKEKRAKNDRPKKKTSDNLENEYDRLVAGRIFVPPNIYEQAQGILAQIQALANKLGGFWDSLGIVNSYYITWDGSWRDRK